MHDCRQTQENLFDLIFGEADAARAPHALEEVGACAACLAEYRSLAATLDLCDEATAALTPRESYWPQYHAALTRRLLDAVSSNGGGGDAPHESTQFARATETAASERVPVWRRLLTTSFRVPAPLAACVVLLLVSACALSLWLATAPAPAPIVVAAPAASLEAAPQIKFVEVPVVEERTVTQTIYVPRLKGSGSNDNPRRTSPRESLAADRQTGNAPRPDADPRPPRANLSGFKPAGEVNLRIIKGSDAREQ